MNDLFIGLREQKAPAWVGYVDAISTPMARPIGRPSNHSLPFDISNDVSISLKDDVPPTERTRLLTSKKIEIEDYIKDKCRHDHRFKGEVSLHENFIQIRRRKQYGSEQTRTTNGIPAIKAWQDMIRKPLFRDLKIEETERNTAHPHLCITPRNTRRGHDNWLSSLIIWAEDGTAEMQTGLLGEALRNLRDQLNPNLKNTTVQRHGDIIKIDITRDHIDHINTFRDEVMRISRAEGRNFGEHSKAPFPEHIMQAIQSQEPASGRS